MRSFDKNRKYYIYLAFKLFCAFLIIVMNILTILNLSGFGQQIKSNLISYLFILFFIVTFAIKEKISINVSYIWFHFTLLSFLISTFVNDGNYLFTLQVILTLGFIPSMQFLGRDKKIIKLISYIYTIATALVLIDFKSDGITGGWNTNVIGMIGLIGILYIGYIFILSSKINKIVNIVVLLSFLSLIAYTDARSPFVGMLFLLILYKKIYVKGISYTKYKLLNMLIFIIPVIVIIFIILLSHTNLFTQLNELSSVYTDKTFISGRDIIWSKIVNNMNAKWILGFGDRYQGNTHNIFLYIVYSYGIVGYVLYSLFFIQILNSMYKYMVDPIIRYGIVCFLTIYIQQSFEVLLFDVNTLVFGHYLFLSIIIGRIK